MIINWSIVYQHRVVEFLRQDDIISIIASRYEGAITDDLRCVTMLPYNDVCHIARNKDENGFHESIS